MKGVFICGTDTDIGKTVVASLFMVWVRKRMPVCYWKPVQTGIEVDSDTETVARIANCSPSEIHDQGIRLERPLSPHLSARLAGQRVSISDIIDLAPRPDDGRFLIVEGAGGVLVPLNDNELMVDLIAEIGFSAVIVSRSGLGTINHTLLTLEALRRRNIAVAGVVMNGEPNRDNREALEDFGKVTVLAEIPMIEKLSFETVSRLSEELTFEFSNRPTAA